MVTNSLSERRGAGPGRSKIRWIIGDPFIASSTMVKMVVRTVAFSSICSALLVCVVYTLKHTTVLFPCQQLPQCGFELLLGCFDCFGATRGTSTPALDVEFIISSNTS